MNCIRFAILLVLFASPAVAQSTAGKTSVFDALGNPVLTDVATQAELDAAVLSGGGVTLTSTYVGYGSGTNTVTGEAAFNYNAGTDTLSVGTLQLGSGSSIFSTATPTIKFSNLIDNEDITLAIGLAGNNTVLLESSTGINIFDFGTVAAKVPQEVYDATGWNGNLTAPTKDAVRDVIETTRISVAEDTLLGRYSAGTGAAETVTLGAQFSVAGGVLTLVPDYIEANENLVDLTDGALEYPLTLNDGLVLAGPTIAALPAMSGTTMNLTKYGETYSASADSNLTTSGTPATGQVYLLDIAANGGGPYTTGIPEGFDPNTGANVSSVITPAGGLTSLVYKWSGARWNIYGVPVSTTGTGSYALNQSPVLQTPSIVGGITLPDGVRQSFNPSLDRAGFNFGAVNGNPSTDLVNGDAWYNTATGKIMVQENGTIKEIGAGAGGMATTDIDTSEELRAILTDETGTGSAVFSNSPTFTGTVTIDTVNIAELRADDFSFEGASVDNFETVLDVVNPTADRSILLPNRSGTVALDDSTSTQSLLSTLTGGTTQGAVAVRDAAGWTTIAPGTSGHVLTTNGAGANVTWAAPSGGGGSAPTIASARQTPPLLWEDYHGVISSTSVPAGDFGFTVEGTGSAVGTPVAGITTAPGQQQFYTNTSTTGYRGAMSGGTAAANILFGGGSYNLEHSFFVGQASDASGTYGLRFGFVDSISSTEPTDGVYFRCAGVSPVNWFAVARSNNTETATDTGVAAATSGRVTLRIAVNAAGTQALFYINGTLVRTETANIPTGSGRNTAVGYAIIKSAGASDRWITMDYSGMEIGLTSSR